MSKSATKTNFAGRRKYPKNKTPRMPDGSKFRVNVRFPKPVHALVHAAAAKTEESVNEFIVQASASRAKSLVEAG